MSDATDKAVILARGLGTRMRRRDAAAAVDARQAAVAETGVKAMIPIDRPFLDYVLHVLAEAGYGRVCLVIGPEHEEVRRYYEQTLRPTRLAMSFAIQAEPRGTADAVAAAEAFAGDDPFLVLNSDNYYPAEACRALRTLDSAGLAIFEKNAMVRGGNIPAERVAKFAVADVDQQGHLRRIIEKPDEQVLRSLGEPLYVSMNCWRFTPSIFEACRRISPSRRGELEITDAVQYVIDRLDEPFRALPFELPVLDLSSREDIAAVAARLRGTEVRI